MSYVFHHSKLHDKELINLIYRYNKKPDKWYKSRTCNIMKHTFMIREHLDKNTLTMKKILYGLFFSNLPSALLINVYDEMEWEEHVKSNIHSFINTTPIYQV